MSTPGAAGLGSPERIARAMSDVVAVMDRLRSPGGCPWDAEQTHAGLAPYAIEEAHEVAEAAESGDGTLREELGDLLLQVLFQARIAQEGPDGATPFDLADVARTLEAKLRRRHPHVFADATAVDAQQVAATWEDIKAAERAASPTGAVAGEASVLAGVPTSLPALAAAQKVLARARRAGIAVGPSYPEHGDEQADLEADIGAELVALVARAQAAGVDAEAALRAQVRGLRAQVREAESSA
ncbi:MazG family protein [Serinibacter salmoneus]|uniref:XTP/dITP diphosphohydrolase n=1 Tax=Serinibacter salmoneus TaxID=556530 RepID=A0A2A9D2I1_9MICO|nr:MazG family protein [Serinibacter salmoneus]PFG20455.1 XTP/dITP diphosphohydrolase [Serinibacter salmoneus]